MAHTPLFTFTGGARPLFSRHGQQLTAEQVLGLSPEDISGAVSVGSGGDFLSTLGEFTTQKGTFSPDEFNRLVGTGFFSGEFGGPEKFAPISTGTSFLAGSGQTFGFPTGTPTTPEGVGAFSTFLPPVGQFGAFTEDPVEEESTLETILRSVIDVLPGAGDLIDIFKQEGQVPRETVPGGTRPLPKGTIAERSEPFDPQPSAQTPSETGLPGIGGVGTTTADIDSVISGAPSGRPEGGFGETRVIDFDEAARDILTGPGREDAIFESGVDPNSSESVIQGAVSKDLEEKQDLPGTEAELPGDDEVTNILNNPILIDIAREQNPGVSDADLPDVIKGEIAESADEPRLTREEVEEIIDASNTGNLEKIEEILNRQLTEDDVTDIINTALEGQETVQGTEEGEDVASLGESLLDALPGLVGTIGQTLIEGRAGEKAAETNLEATLAGISGGRELFDLIRGDLRPFLEAGVRQLPALEGVPARGEGELIPAPAVPTTAGLPGLERGGATDLTNLISIAGQRGDITAAPVSPGGDFRTLGRGGRTSDFLGRIGEVTGAEEEFQAAPGVPGADFRDPRLTPDLTGLPDPFDIQDPVLQNILNETQSRVEASAAARGRLGAGGTGLNLGEALTQQILERGESIARIRQGLVGEQLDVGRQQFGEDVTLRDLTGAERGRQFQQGITAGEFDVSQQADIRDQLFNELIQAAGLQDIIGERGFERQLRGREFAGLERERGFGRELQAAEFGAGQQQTLRDQQVRELLDIARLQESAGGRQFGESVTARDLLGAEEARTFGQELETGAFESDQAKRLRDQLFGELFQIAELGEVAGAQGASVAGPAISGISNLFSSQGRTGAELNLQRGATQSRGVGALADLIDQVLNR